MTRLAYVLCHGYAIEDTLTEGGQEVLYKVKWEGWDNEEDRTFEPEDNL